MTAALELLAERGVAGMSIEEVASRAGVGKATIYRRWSSKGALALDAFLVEFKQRQPLPDTGTLRGDLRAELRAWITAVTRTPTDGYWATSSARPSTTRNWPRATGSAFSSRSASSTGSCLTGRSHGGEIPAGSDREVILDLLFGAAQHRLLLGHLPLTDRFVRDVVDVIVGCLQAPGSS